MSKKKFVMHVVFFLIFALENFLLLSVENVFINSNEKNKTRTPIPVAVETLHPNVGDTALPVAVETPYPDVGENTITIVEAIPAPAAEITKELWIHRCGFGEPDGVDYYDWIAFIPLDEGTPLGVKITFSNRNYVVGNEKKFVIYGTNHKNEILLIDRRGNFLPDDDFIESESMKEFPGGYPEFEKVLKNSGIDWEKLYLRLENEWEEKFRERIQTGETCPDPDFFPEWKNL